MRQTLLCMGLAAVAALGTGLASGAPSDGCDSGQVTPGTTPAGVGVLVEPGAPGPATARGCNTGATVPSPAKGKAEIYADPNGQGGYVEVDGDGDNDADVACADGFARVAMGTGGPLFYESGAGSFNDTKPGEDGSQRAEAESPDVFAQNVAANCAPA